MSARFFQSYIAYEFEKAQISQKSWSRNLFAILLLFGPCMENEGTIGVDEKQQRKKGPIICF